MRRLLIVFARAPVAGRCKTRLIPRYGARGAARIHRALVRRTLETACAAASTANAPVQLWCEPDSRHGFFLACRRRYGITLKTQPRGDLGRKMGLALARGVAAGAHAVLIGTDCAALTAADVHDAFAALDAGYAQVLQPAADGGYVLIGARVAAPCTLRAVAWSSGRELMQTRMRMARRGLSCALLPPLWDVDHPRDVRWARQLGLLPGLPIRGKAC